VLCDNWERQEHWTVEMLSHVQFYTIFEHVTASQRIQCSVHTGPKPLPCLSHFFVSLLLLALLGYHMNPIPTNCLVILDLPDMYFS
jgi:hypothetical protein